MKNGSLSRLLRNILALILLGYFSIFSPLVALALTQPVSAPITIPVPVPVPSPTITVSPQTVVSGNNITVSWNVPNASSTDYIKVLTAVGNKNGSGPLSPSNNCNLNNVSGPNAVTLGGCSFTSAVIVDLGIFKLAYYNSVGTLLAQSQTFQVLPASSGSFIANPANIGIGQSVNLNWASITNAHPKDYINYLNDDNYTGTATGHTYWPSNNCAWLTDSTTAKTSGACNIESPLFTGKYKLVYRSGNVPLGQPAPILAVSNTITVSTPTPAPIPMPGAPEMVYPQNGQTLDLEGAYMFKVKPVAGASGYLFGLFQNNVMVYENYRDNKTLSSNGEFVLGTSNPFHAKFQAGKVDVMIRAMVNGRWSDARTINITLKPRVVITPLAVTSITPSSGIFSAIVNVYGSGFDNKKGSVTFYNKANQAVAGAPILGWYDGGIKFRVPAVTKGSYQIEIQRADGRKSNRVAFTVTASQPIISTIQPGTLRAGNYFLIYGQQFGNLTGKVNLFNPNSPVIFANANIYYWSDNLIVGQIPSKIGGNKEYGIQVRTSDLRDSSLIYRFISK